MPKFKLITITNLTIALTIVAFIFQNIIKDSELIFGLNMYFLLFKLWWQPLSSMFIHGGILHLLMNMAVLYQFGNILEYYFGKKTFILLYFIGGIIASLLSFVYIYYFDISINLIVS